MARYYWREMSIARNRGRFNLFLSSGTRDISHPLDNWHNANIMVSIIPCYCKLNVTRVYVVFFRHKAVRRKTPFFIICLYERKNGLHAGFTLNANQRDANIRAQSFSLSFMLMFNFLVITCVTIFSCVCVSLIIKWYVYIVTFT